jgi:hypothetical protein
MTKDKVYIIVIVLLAIALIAGCALQAQQTSKRLSVSKIIVPKEGLKFETEDGKPIAFMSASEDGGTLSIINNQKKPVVMMGAGKDGGTLAIINNQQKVSIGLMAGGLLSIFNNQEKSVVNMGTDDKDGGALIIRDNQGNTIWSKP